MIRFIQSYAVPESIGDSTIFKAVVSHFKDDVVVVPFYSERVRNLSKKESINNTDCYYLLEKLPSHLLMLKGEKIMKKQRKNKKKKK